LISDVVDLTDRAGLGSFSHRSLASDATNLTLLYN